MVRRALTAGRAARRAGRVKETDMAEACMVVGCLFAWWRQGRKLEIGNKPRSIGGSLK
jgi:hypothetical protein